MAGRTCADVTTDSQVGQLVRRGIGVPGGYLLPTSSPVLTHNVQRPRRTKNLQQESSSDRRLSQVGMNSGFTPS